MALGSVGLLLLAAVLAGARGMRLGLADAAFAGVVLAVAAVHRWGARGRAGRVLLARRVFAALLLWSVAHGVAWLR